MICLHKAHDCQPNKVFMATAEPGYLTVLYCKRQLIRVTSLFLLQYPAALMNLGAILHLNGKLQEAEANYLRALQLKPDDTITQSNLRKLWNIMEKQGLRTMGPWGGCELGSQPTICAPTLGKDTAPSPYSSLWRDGGRK